MKQGFVSARNGIMPWPLKLLVCVWGKLIMYLDLWCLQSVEVCFPFTAKKPWLLSQRKMHLALSLWNKKRLMRRRKERRMSRAAPARRTRKMTQSLKGRPVSLRASVHCNCVVLEVWSNVRKASVLAFFLYRLATCCVCLGNLWVYCFLPVRRWWLPSTSCSFVFRFEEGTEASQRVLGPRGWHR